MVIIKKTDNNKVNKDVEKPEHSYTSVVIENGSAASWQFLKKLNTELSKDPAILHLGIHPRENRCHIKLAHQCSRGAQFIIVKSRNNSNAQQLMN